MIFKDLAKPGWCFHIIMMSGRLEATYVCGQDMDSQLSHSSHHAALALATCFVHLSILLKFCMYLTCIAVDIRKYETKSAEMTRLRVNQE